MSDPATPLPKNIDYSESMNVGRVHESVKREKDVNQPGNEPVSLGAFLLMVPFLLVAGLFVGAFKDGSAMVPKGDPNIPAGGDAGPMTVEKAFKEGKKLFVSAGCAACHQPNGAGQPGVYPPLVGSEWVSGSDKRMAMVIHSGLIGPVTVAGKVYDGAMPAQGPALRAKKLAYLMTYLRQEWGDGASPVTVEQAQLIFDEFKDRTTQWTVAEIEQLVPADEMLPKVGSYGGEEPAAEVPADQN